MSDPIGGRISDEVVLTRDEAARVLLALDEAVEAVSDVELRRRLEQGAHIIVEKVPSRPARPVTSEGAYPDVDV